MFFPIEISPQTAFSLNGLWNLNDYSTTLLNNLDNNPSNYLMMKDWGLTFSYGAEFSKPISSNLYLISLSKRVRNNYFTIRYTPGFQKEFVFSNGNSIVLADSSVQSLNSYFIYKEIMGLGYSYRFLSNLSAGFSLRYFKQEFNNENFKPVLTDTLYYLERENQIESVNFWKGDIGFNYSFDESFNFSVASINLFNFGEQSVSDESKFYKIRNTKAAVLGLFFSPFQKTSLNVLYETTGNFQAGISQSINIYDSNYDLNLTVLHDKFQLPFINGMVADLAYSNNLWGVSLSYIKYFSNRNKLFSFSEFKSDGMNNLMHNKYSYDKAIMTFSFTLNTTKEKLVEFLSLNVVREIYPTFQEAYSDSPFAVGNVTNLTNKSVLVKPSCKIDGINKDFIQSNALTIPPRDTVSVPFYAVVPDNYSNRRTDVAQTYFIINTDSEEPDDRFQSSSLVFGVNNWDGRVRNLKYFIKKDMDFSMNYAKNLLSNYKNSLDSINYLLMPFYKAKFIFNDLVKEFVYVSDPRATTDYVQFPNETIELRGGDCDDLSVCYSSLLEAVGIETALIDYKNGDAVRHVSVLLNTNLQPDNAKLITDNDKKYFIRKSENGNDEIWIPIETTSLTNFELAWSLGSEKFNLEALENFGLALGKVEIVDVY